MLSGFFVLFEYLEFLLCSVNSIALEFIKLIQV